MISAVALVTVLLASPGAFLPEAPFSVVTGVVVTDSGRPIRDAYLTVLRPTNGAFDVFDAPFRDSEVRSDANGRFTLRTARGQIAVVASVRTDTAITLRLTPLQVTADRAHVIVRFDGTASIRGQALDESGRPLAKVWVTAVPERTGQAAARGDAIVVRTWTAEDGKFLLAGLAPGEHRLLARGNGYRCNAACEYREGMRVRTGQAAVNVPLETIGSIAGRVVRLDGAGEAQPVTAFSVQSTAFGPANFESADGAFEIEVMRSRKGAPVFVIAPDLAPFASRFDLSQPVTVDLGEIMLGPRRTVRGYVRDDSGNPIEGARIRVGFAEGALERPAAMSDATGAFELSGVSEGAAPLTVSHRQFGPVDITAEPGAIELEVCLSARDSLRFLRSVR